MTGCESAPPKLHTRRRFLMITHDQEIDRRILQQARSLMQRGWDGVIVCLSHNANDVSGRENDLDIHRIGLSKITPDCPVYQSYQRRQLAVLKWFYTQPHVAIKGRWPKAMRLVDLGFKHISRVNGLFYQVHLYAHYHNRRITCPLPFDECFYSAASARSADIIIAHDLPALPAAVKLAKQWNVPLVYDAHELYYEQTAFSQRQKDMMRRTEARLIHQCNATFTVNHSIAQEMARRYGCPKPNVLLNALDRLSDENSSDVLNNSNLLREHLQLQADQRILLFQGGLLANRNLETLASAMRFVQTKDCVLVFMGNGALRQSLEAIATRGGFGSRVRFVPAVAPEDLLEWTASADVGIIPYPSVDLNTHFCTPNKLFEYIQAGVPILANDLPELRRYVQDTGFGATVAMVRPQAIAAGIDQFLGDPGALRAARAKILQRRHEFDWTHASQDYVRIIESLCGATVPC